MKSGMGLLSDPPRSPGRVCQRRQDYSVFLLECDRGHMIEQDDVARAPTRRLHALLPLSHVLRQHRHHRALVRPFRVLQGSPAVLCVCVCVCVCVCMCVCVHVCV